MSAQEISRREDGTLACPACGGEEFQYEENYSTWRAMASNGSGTLVFDADFEWDMGDDNPGVVCADLKCGAELNTSGVEIDFQ